MPNFEVVFLPDAVSFLEELDQKARDKVYYNIRKAREVKDDEIFKKLTEDIWEFRTLYGGNAYRLFAFWDKSMPQATLVVATHGFHKKVQKTPKKEIKRAVQIRQVYLDFKNQTP